MGLKVISFNVRGLNSPFRRAHLWTELLKSKCDIAFIQESHLLEADAHRCVHRRFPHIFYSHASKKKSAGVFICIKSSIAFSLNKCTVDTAGRYVIINCTINEKPITLATAYAPNVGQLAFCKKFLNKVQSLAVGDVIIGGDFNAPIDSEIDTNSLSSRSRADLQTIIQESPFHDIWRYQHGGERDFTFISPVHLSQTRIDFILVTKNLLHKVVRSDIGSATWSDHAPVSIEVNNGLPNPPPPQWRMNSYLVKCPERVKGYSGELQNFFGI